MALQSFRRTLSSFGQRSVPKWPQESFQAVGRGWFQNRLFQCPPPELPKEFDASQFERIARLVDFDNPDPEVKVRVLEGLLLISREPLSARKLATLAGLADPTQARTLARRLNEQYDACGHAFRIEEVAGGMQMLTRPQFAPWLRRLEHVPGEELLSQGMLETLAIIAYRQPLLRAEIEAIRGVSCDEVLRQLMQRDVVRICGRHEDLGRPFLYGTTKRFLQLFGLQSLDSLPRAQKIRSAEAETATRLAGNSLSAQDIDGKVVGEINVPHSTLDDHH